MRQFFSPIDTDPAAEVLTKRDRHNGIAILLSVNHIVVYFSRRKVKRHFAVNALRDERVSGHSDLRSVKTVCLAGRNGAIFIMEDRLKHPHAVLEDSKVLTQDTTSLAVEIRN